MSVCTCILKHWEVYLIELCYTHSQAQGIVCLHEDESIFSYLQLTQPHVLYLGSEYRVTSGTCGEKELYNTIPCTCMWVSVHALQRD